MPSEGRHSGERIKRVRNPNVKGLPLTRYPYILIADVAFRQRMLGLPSKTARALTTMTDSLEIQKLLTAEVREALGELRGFGQRYCDARRDGVARLVPKLGITARDDSKSKVQLF